MSATKRRILCVEDDADTCELLSFMLGREDYEITCVRTVAEGLFFARSGFFDLYLLDQRFVDGTGIELCEKIRLSDSHTPVIFFSALSQHGDRERAIAAGATAYLIKPNDIDVLAFAVRRLLSEFAGMAYV
jgi:two-component system, OmpR family, alkaline phosphatase synthesis response regulator PhoP